MPGTKNLAEANVRGESGAESMKSSNPAPLNGEFVNTIRERAYQLYESRLAENKVGDPVSDWLEAEEQVRKENGAFA